MKLVEIYKCLGDETRLRILQLLAISPLCVCHVQQVIGKSQVIISQHLSYLKKRRLVEARRHQQWMVYSIAKDISREFTANLKCFQNCAALDAAFIKDRDKFLKLMGSKNVAALLAEGCCVKTHKDKTRRYSCK